MIIKVKNCILLVILLLPSLTKAQHDSLITNRLNVRMAPLSFIDFYSGSCYKLGFEVRTFRQFSITGDFGGYFRNFNGFKNFSGYNVDIGLRYYLNKNYINQRFYLMLNYFYKNQGFDFTYFVQEETANKTEFRTQKYVTCMNVNFGWLKLYKNRFVLDLFAGIGVRYKKVNSTLSEQKFQTGNVYSDSQSLFFVLTPGKFIYPNINVGLRIGLRLF